MNPSPNSTAIWDVAVVVCTDRQYRVLELRERHGLSWRQIELATGRGPATVRGHYRAALHNLHRHLVG